MTKGNKMNLEDATNLFLNPITTQGFLDSHRDWLLPVLINLPNPNAILERNKSEEIFVALGKVLKLNRHLWRFADNVFRSDFPPYKGILEEIDECQEPKKKSTRLDHDCHGDRVQDVLESCQIFCQSHPYFHNLWEWAELLGKVESFQSVQHRWLILEVLKTSSKISAKEQKEFASQLMSEDEYRTLSIKFVIRKQNENNVGNDEDKGFRLAQNLEGCGYKISFVQDVPIKCEGNKSTADREESKIHLPQSRNEILRKIAMCISKEEPVILSAVSGAGKTTLIQYLSNEISRKTEFVNFHRVQISDETDARTLIGSYTCSSTPGVFHWTDGILAQCLIQGSWILIEDLDQATEDVLSVILSFIENKELYIPSRKLTLKPSPGFQMLITKSETEVKWKASCTEIQLPSYTDLEMQEILIRLFPEMKFCAEKMCQVLNFFGKEHRVSQSRLLNLRDLIYWSQRCRIKKSKSGDISRETLFSEAVHVFCNHLTRAEDKIFRAEMISRIFQTEHNPEFHIKNREIKVDVTNDFLDVDGVRFTIKTDFQSRSNSFCLTQQALTLLDFLAASIKANQPCLLVGETGVGKTSAIQYLAATLGKNLHVINVCENSESSDLFGAFKPIDISVHCRNLVGKLENLMKTTFNQLQTQFLSKLYHLVSEKCWKEVLNLVNFVIAKALIKVNKGKRKDLREDWEELQDDACGALKTLELQTANMFAFIKGVLTEAIEKGDWVLLDEVNLAEKEVLTSLCSLFNNTDSIRLNDGKNTVINKHPDFRLFGCMNPSTDVGKKDLPSNFRSNFVEFFMTEPQNDKDMIMICQRYLRVLNISKPILDKIVKFYRRVKALSRKSLSDGTGKIPAYSLRTLCRSLQICAKNPCQNVEQSLIESLSICFLTELDRNSYGQVLSLITKCIKAPRKNFVMPSLNDHVEIEGYNVKMGRHEARIDQKYILTQTVRCNLKDVARIVSFSQYPILLQGETSVGKTSLIKYIAEASGNKLVRINNHEHTDIQEYIGSYGSDEKGNFCFKEGILAQAMRFGFWLILDELNLASTEILEALNRVLDDNRELFISETQVRIKAHPDFRIFATQNPAGSSYGGRKILSRAFRNRFVEIHFDELNPQELEEVIEKKCQIPAKLSKNIVKVMQELQKVRKSSEAFKGKKGFITLRDLFRWASRYQLIQDFNIWQVAMAEEGYLVLASRCRKPEEAKIIKSIIEKVFKKILVENFFDLNYPAHVLSQEMSIIKNLKMDLALTTSMVRMLCLLLHSFKSREPVLLIGNTGLGKTSVCQAIAEYLDRKLYYLSCHLNTDASDFLGSLRPCRSRDSNQLFEWQDGPLVRAMVDGAIFLLDEISLADDSVIERVNSALEEERSMVIPEKPSVDEVFEIKASQNFVMCATMNPGGDFGKKELSPALRNRFMEVWCPSETTEEDLKLILAHLLQNIVETRLLDVMVRYIQTANKYLSPHSFISFRDVKTWTTFIKTNIQTMNVKCCIVHGACLTLLDGLDTLDSFGNLPDIQEFKQRSHQFFQSQLRHENCMCLDWILNRETVEIHTNHDHIMVGSFPVQINPGTNLEQDLFLDTPTIKQNLFKVVRGSQIGKPILLEGSPGVGKSALVQALASASRNHLIRINLSDQTDIADLFGSDLPSCEEDIGKFSWQDGPFLAALKSGHWILLDELNLATQSVLEGLNACLDHRGEVFIPELGKTFFVSNKSKIFATQNPYKDGSGRKGLPKSFLNRFVKVFMSSLSNQDSVQICKHKHPNLDQNIIEQLVSCLNDLNEHFKGRACLGGPWNFNLRDLQRWCQGIMRCGRISDNCITRLGKTLFISRIRTKEDRKYLNLILSKHFRGRETAPGFQISENFVQIGSEIMWRQESMMKKSSCNQNFALIRNQLEYLEQMITCLNSHWIPIVVGDHDTGKTSMINILAKLAGVKLVSMSVNPLSDASELLGSFEQTDALSSLSDIRRDILDVIDQLRRKVKGKILRDLIVRRETLAKASDAPTLTEIWIEIKAILLQQEASCMDTNDHSDHFETSCIDRQMMRFGNSKEDSVRFEWVDSPLVQAIEKGHWLVLENANFCPTSVLDRLNGLFEPNGKLILGESGIDPDTGRPRTISPHPDFRIFLTMNPKFGELSDAMRNRCVEIFLDTGEELGSFHLAAKVQDLCHFPEISVMVQQLRFLHENFGSDLKFLSKSFLKFSSKEDLATRLKVLNEFFPHLSTVDWNDGLFQFSNSSNVVDSRYFSLGAQKCDNRNLAKLELWMNHPKVFSVQVVSPAHHHVLTEMDSDLKYCFDNALANLDAINVFDEDILILRKFLLGLCEMKRIGKKNTEPRFKALGVILSKIFAESRKDSAFLTRLYPNFLKDTKGHRYELLDFFRTIEIWPKLNSEHNCQEFKIFLDFSKSFSPYLECPKDVYKEKLENHYGFVQVQNEVSWFALLLEDALVNQRNFLRSCGLRDEPFEDSWFYPLLFKSFIAQDPRSWHPKVILSLELHQSCRQHIWRYFLPEEVDVQQRDFVINHLFEVFFHENTLAKLYQIKNFDMTKKICRLTSEMLDHNSNVLDAIQIQKKRLMMEFHQDLFIKITNSLVPLRCQSELNIWSRIRLIEHQLHYKFKDVQYDDEMVIEFGRFYFNLALQCQVDSSLVFEEEIKLLEKETKLVSDSLRADQICYFLQHQPGHEVEGVSHHPLTRLSHTRITENKRKIDEIKSYIPVRIERFDNIKRDLNSLKNGIMKPTSIEEKVRRIQTLDQDNYEDIENDIGNWEVNILRAVTNLEVTMSSFQEIYTLVSLGMIETLQGVKAMLEAKKREVFQKEIHKTRTQIEDLSNQNIGVSFESFLLQREMKSREIFLDKYQELMGNLSFAEFELPMKNYHQKALTTVVERSCEANSNLNNICQIVSDLKEMSLDVQKRLLDQFPEQPFLLAITRSVDKILSHSILGSKLEYQISLENLRDEVYHWNRSAHLRIKIPISYLENFLTSWKKSDLDELKQTTQRCLKHLNRRVFSKLLKFQKLCDKISCSDQMGSKSSWIFGSLILFGQSCFVTEFPSLLEALGFLEDWYQSRSATATNLIKIAVSFLRLHEVEIKKLSEELVRKAEKLGHNLYKTLVLKKDLTCLKISREQKKLEAETLKLLSVPIPVQEFDLDTKFDFISGVLQPLSRNYPSPKAYHHSFLSSDGKLLGDSSVMAQKAQDRLSCIKFNEQYYDLGVDDLKETFEMLNKDNLSKRDKYMMRQNLANRFKDLHSEGFSYLFGNRFDVNSSQIVPKCEKFLSEESNILKCLSQFDLMVEHLKKPQRHVDKDFLDRAKGFSSHLLLSVLDLKFVSNVIEQKVASFNQKLNEIDSPQQSGLKEKLRTVLKSFQDLRRPELVENVKDTLEKLVKGDEPPKEMAAELNRAKEDIFQVCEKFLVTQESIQDYKNLCRIRTLLNRAKSSKKDERRNMRKVNPQLVSKHFQHLKKLLNSILQVKKYFSKLEDEKIEIYKSISEVVNFAKSLDLVTREEEFDSLLSWLRSNQDSFHDFHEILHEGVPIQRTFLESLLLIGNNIEMRLTKMCHFTFLFMKICSLFAQKKYNSDEDNESDNNESDAKGPGKPSDGCGLGEGTGDKSTLEGVESEDLFEHQTEDDKDGENEDSSSQKDDDFVDYSEDLDTNAEDIDRPNDDDDNNDSGDEEQGEEDIEEGTAEEKDKETKDEILNSEDWEENIDDEHQRKDKSEKSDALSDKQTDPDNEINPNEEENNQDHVRNDEDPDKRERLPDQEDDLQDMDVDMEDNIHNQEHKEEEIEDFEMNDPDMNEARNSDTDSENDLDETPEDEIERMPDFKEDDKESGDNSQDTNEAPREVNEAQNQDSNKEDKKDPEGGAMTSQENDDDNENNDSESSKPSKDFNSRDNEKGQAKLEDETLDTNEKSNDKMEEDEEAEDTSGTQEQMEHNEVVQTDEKEIISANEALDVERSESYAHMNEQESVEKSSHALDSVSFNNLKKMKLEISEKYQEVSHEDEESLDNNENAMEDKPILNQPLDQSLINHLEEMQKCNSTHWVTRGPVSFQNQVQSVERSHITADIRKMDLNMDTDVQFQSENVKKWLQLCSSTADKSQYLMEQLRLIMEPTKITRLRGDYSSGKRLNMKRIIPYIASNFRKDKIWLRRTKPAKRDNQIVLAVDDSSSMSDNMVPEMCYESLAIICTAMSTVEAGDVGVVKFGTDASVILPFKNNFSSHDGAHILSKFSFSQPNTDVVKLLALAKSLFTKDASNPLNKLLIVLSDGHGVFNSGRKETLDAVREMRLHGIFMIYVILESKDNEKSSVFDLLETIFDDENPLPNIQPYMDSFPFPFYIVLRDMEKLPQVLSDSLRQWFELVLEAV